VRPPACVSCDLPVLELVGQFTILAPYLDEQGSLPSGMAGTWHLSCVATASSAAQWGQALIENYVQTRQYDVVASLPAWTVVRSPRTQETLALGDRGATLPLSGRWSRPDPGRGVLRLYEPAYWLEWDQPAIAEVQATLRRVGEVPVLRVAELLGSAHRLTDVDVLVDAVFIMDEELMQDWQTTAVGAPVRHAVRLPPELAPYCAS